MKKLQKWGDDLNEVIVDRVEQEHQALVNEQSVWELGYSKVEAAVATILTSCQVREMTRGCGRMINYPHKFVTEVAICHSQ